MSIKTPEDWWSLLELIRDDIAAYAAEHKCEWSQEELDAAIESRNHGALVVQLNQLWIDLPDSPDIRHYPFFEICDLCSECEVLEESP